MYSGHNNGGRQGRRRERSRHREQGELVYREGEIGLSEKSATLLIDEYGELEVQRHAMYCLWMMDQGKVHVPPAWLTASLRGDWSAPHGMPNDWLPTVLRFRVDENTFAEFTREVRGDKRTT